MIRIVSNTFCAKFISLITLITILSTPTLSLAEILTADAINTSQKEDISLSDAKVNLDLNDNPVTDFKEKTINADEVNPATEKKTEITSDSKTVDQENQEQVEEPIQTQGSFDNDVNGSNSVNIKSPSSYKIETNTGALNYNYNIRIPEGRNNLTPSLNLNYNPNRNNNQNWAGYGWELSVPYIERINKSGVENLYSENNFYSQIDGDLIYSTSSNIFEPKKNNSKSEYMFENNAWQIKNKNGTFYHFSNISDSVFQDASNTNNINTWYLTDINDISGNNIHYSYFKDNGFVYINSIIYTNSLSNGTAGVYEIKFVWEDRVDYMENYSKGFYTLNNKRLDKVEVWVAGTIRKEFRLNYTTGVNDVRSLLSSIGEYGYELDGTLSSVPEIVFTYSKANREYKSFNLPAYEQGTFDKFMDVNGDGNMDMVLSRDRYINIYHKRVVKVVYLGNGNGNFETNVISNNEYCYSSDCSGGGFVPVFNQLPFSFSYADNYSLGGNSVFASDFNGDGYVDVSGEQFNGVKNKVNASGTLGIATSTLFWEHDNTLPTTYGSILSYNLNGDKKTDYIYSLNGYSGIEGLKYYSKVYKDLNNDGLDDWFQAYYKDESWCPPAGGSCGWAKTYFNKVAINDGKNNFIEVQPADISKYNLLPYYYDGIWYDTSYSPVGADFNMDGLEDYVYYYNGLLYIQINKGNGFTESFADEKYFYYKDNVAGVDINSDGVGDIVTWNGDVFSANVSKGKSDILTSVKNELGAVSSFEYASASSYRKDNNESSNSIPFPVMTVKKEIINDGISSTSTREYYYEGLDFINEKPFENTVTGFNKVVTKESNGSKTIDYFHQGNGNSANEFRDEYSKIGYSYRTERYDSSNVLKRTVDRVWNTIPSFNNSSSTSVVLKNEFTTDYHSDGINKMSKAKTYDYDNELNLTEEVSIGEAQFNLLNNEIVDIDSGDTSRVFTKYSTSTINSKLTLPISKIKYDSLNREISKELYFYDNNLNENINNGFLTEKRTYVDSLNFLSNKYSYDTSFGLINSSTDYRGNTISYIYDDYKMYPKSIVNSLNQENKYEYDYLNSKVKKETDSNNLVKETVYDSLGREIKIIINGNLIESNNFDMSKNLIVNTKFLDNSSTNTIVKNLYFNGLGKILQTKVLNNENKFTTQLFKYDNNHDLVLSTGFYESLTADSTLNDSLNSNMLLKFKKDWDGRNTEIEDFNGVEKYVYELNEITKIDRNNVPIKFKMNNMNLVSEIVEHNGDYDFVTKYTYDLNGKLIKIVDSENSERNIKYDMLGRKTYDEAAHLGTSTDKFVNIIYSLSTSSNTESESIKYNYSNNESEINYLDILGRKTSVKYKKGTSPFATISSYFYDNCLNGIGKLCMSSSTDGVVRSFEYDSFGRINLTNTIVSNQYWIASSTVRSNFDLQNNLISKSDGYVNFVYTFKNGLLSEISYRQDNSSSSNKLVNNIKYTSNLKPLSYERNNLKVTNTYYDNYLSNLQNEKVELNKIGTSTTDLLRSTSYLYDKLNRVSNINVYSPEYNSSENYTYDDLSRLTNSIKTYSLNATNSTTTEINNFIYSSTGRILDQNGISRVYGVATNSDFFVPTKIGSDILKWDKRGRLTSSTALGTLTWGDNNRVKSITKGATSTNHFYDVDGNRIMSIDTITSGTSSVKVVSKRYTPDSGIINNGSTTNYQVLFAGKPIVSLDKQDKASELLLSTTTLNILKIGDRETTGTSTKWNEFKTFTNSTTTTISNSTTNKTNSISAFLGKKGKVETKQRFNLSNLSTTSSQTITIYAGAGLNNKTFKTKIISGNAVITSGDSFSFPGGTSTLKYFDLSRNITFNSSSTEVVLEISSNSTTSDNYFYIDQYSLNLYEVKLSTTTGPIYSTFNIESLITDHLGSNVQSISFETGSTTSLTTYSSTGLPNNLKKNPFDSPSNRLYTNHQYDTLNNLSYMNDRYESPIYNIFISPDSIQLLDINSLNNQNYLSNPQNLNPYTYVLNNPVNNVDPDGRNPLAVALRESIKGAVIGAITNIAIQGVYDLYNGKLSDADTYTQTALMGAGAGAVTLGMSAKMRVQTELVKGTQKFLLPEAKNLMNGLAKVVFKNENISLSEHAVKQMGQRNFTVQSVENIIKNSIPFEYTQGGEKMLGYLNKNTRDFVAQIKASGVIRTVINDVKDNYINNLLLRK